MSEVRQTTNIGLIVGTLSEKNLTIEEGTYEGSDKKKKACKIVSGTVAIETDNGTFELRVWKRNKNNDGSDNKGYKGFETVCNTYVSRAEASKSEDNMIADVVSCTCTLDVNDYVNKEGKLVSSTQLGVIAMSRVNQDTEKTSEFNFEGVIRSIKPEVLNDQETGRALVELVTVGYQGKAVPLKLVAEEEIAEVFETQYSAGETCLLYAEMINRRVGGDTKKTASWGRKSQVNTGFDVLEASIIGGEEPYGEDEVDKNGNLKIISIETMKELMNEREMKLETLEKEGYKGKSKGNGKKEASKGMGEKKPLVDASVPF